MRYFLMLLLLPLLAACGGGSTSLPREPTAAPIGSQPALGTLTEAESDARQVPLPTYTPGTNDLLYVENSGNNSITVYRHDANGNMAPQKIISGSRTKIKGGPGILSEDAQGNLYVALQSQILVFAHGANGNVAPIRDLTGPLTGFQSSTGTTIEGMTVDQSTGKLFVTNFYYDKNGSPAFGFSRFPPNANGNEAPFASTELGTIPYGIASDSSGQYIIETSGPGLGDSFNGVHFIAKQFPNGGSPNFGPFGISFFPAYDVVDDPSTRSYFVLGGDDKYNGIVRFAEDTTGYGDDNPGGLEGLTPPPISVLKSPCSGPMALGYLRNLYVACGDAIYVYTPGSAGHTPPLRILKGSATKIDKARGIYEGQ